MPNRKSDATQEGSPKPEADAALPPPGAESEPVEAAAVEPVEPAAETVTVDAAPPRTSRRRRWSRCRQRPRRALPRRPGAGP